MKISDLIIQLEEQKKKNGDKQIIFSQDGEGNAMMSKCFFGLNKGRIVFYPCHYLDE